jgi:hypothetical protein
MTHPIKFRPLLKVADIVLALRLHRAAQRDEKNGFSFAAAMEWRKAAELSAPFTWLADRCWRDWERIMRLPRRLAEPIGVAPVMRLATAQSSASPADLAARPLVAPRMMPVPAA